MSMTWEEARIELQAMKNTCEEYEPGGSRCQMALKVALTALRPVNQERVERMAGEWVQDINKGPAVFYCSSCGESFEIHSYEFQKYRFCPFCMSPMTDEAEEMVMERMEALHHE